MKNSLMSIIVMSMYVSVLFGADTTGVLTVSGDSKAIINGTKYKTGVYNLSHLLTGSIVVKDDSKLIIDGNPIMLGIMDITVCDDSVLEVHAAQPQGYVMSNLIQKIFVSDDSKIILNYFGRSQAYGQLSLSAKDDSRITVYEDESDLSLGRWLIGAIAVNEDSKLIINGWKDGRQALINAKIKLSDDSSRTIGEPLPGTNASTNTSWKERFLSVIRKK